LLLLCRRAAGWRDLVLAARPDVIVVPFSHECAHLSLSLRCLSLLCTHAHTSQTLTPFSRCAHRHGTLDGLLRDVTAALARADSAAGGAASDAGLISIGILSHWKPGAVGLVRGARLNAHHVGASAPLRAALARLAALLRREEERADAAPPALHVLHWPPGRSGADAASAALLRQLAALMGCAVLARGGEGDTSAGHNARHDALGDLYFARGALRGWDAAHVVPFAPSRRAWRRREAAHTADGRYGGSGGDDDSPPGTPLGGAAAAAAAGARLAAVRAYHDAAVDAVNSAAPARGAPRPQRVPLLVLDNLSYYGANDHGEGGSDPVAWVPPMRDGGGGGEALPAWSPAPHAPRAPGRNTPEQVRVALRAGACASVSRWAVF
jgi:hypothetical protein